MIDLSTTKKLAEGLPSANIAVTKAELTESKQQKGTELAGRAAVNIERPNGDVQKNKDAMFAEVKQNLEKLNNYIPVTATNLVFEFDEEGDPPVIKVLDKEGKEVIREIPTEEFREVAKALEEFADKLSSKGLLFNRSA
ncbi:flagellar protein FlaG [Pseudoalteromonas piscicida]|uniref:flagellar protein FlaG n=1 Tax=Pseudoalteromonas piscicida TaxID=43662 RepID=UPI0027E4DA8F|nr:flagellar protein FlaG [Pseudoalteromonas piscicida]WMO14145.1 flagellar protein FlaG [Pseudoalteromonas piscicida]